MNLQETIQQHFTKDNIIDMLTQYKLYYQISLENYVYETLQDMGDTHNKLDELRLELDTNIALSNIFEIILRHGHQDNFEEEFYFHLRKRALMHSLKDFVNGDEELLGKDKYIEQKTKAIANDIYFTESMKLEFESEYGMISENFEMLISDDMVDKIQHNLSLQ
jgi:hypothetical protein